MVDPVQSDGRNPQGPNRSPDPTQAQPEEVPLRGDKSNFQARESLADSVRLHVETLSDREVMQYAEELLSSGNLSVETEKQLRAVFKEVLESRENLRDNVWSVLNADPNRFNAVFGNATNEQLKSFYTHIHGESAQTPQNREDLLKALGNREALASLVSDPSLTADLAQLLLQSGMLTSDERDSLNRALTRVNDSMMKLRDVLAVALTEALLSSYEYRSETQTVDYVGRRIPTGLPVDYSKAMDGSKSPLLTDEGKPFDQHGKEAEILFGISEELRRREEKIEMRKRETEDFDDRLKRAIEELKRDNAPLMQSILGVELEQLQYQHALQHPDKFSFDPRGEVYLFADRQTAQQEEQRKRTAA